MHGLRLKTSPTPFDLSREYKLLHQITFYIRTFLRRNKIAACYLLGIHLFIGLMLLKSDFIGLVVSRFTDVVEGPPEITGFFERVVQYHARMDGNVPDGSVVFIGDSLTQGLCVTAVAPMSINYGIGGDTTVGVLQRLPNYHSLKRAGAIVVTIGNNDLAFRTNREIMRNYSAIIARLPRDIPVIFSPPIPYDEKADTQWSGRNQRVRALSKDLEILTRKSGNLHFVDVGPLLVDAEGNLADRYHDGDGTHLNAKGNEVWITLLRKTVEQAEYEAAAERHNSGSNISHISTVSGVLAANHASTSIQASPIKNAKTLP